MSGLSRRRCLTPGCVRRCPRGAWRCGVHQQDDASASQAQPRQADGHGMGDGTRTAGTHQAEAGVVVVGVHGSDVRDDRVRDDAA